MENFKILEEKENSLFNRKEIQVSIEAEITPNNLEAKKLISEKFSTQIENIKIKKILGKFGSKTFTITTNIYASKEDKEKIEPEKKKGETEVKPPTEMKPEQTEQTQKEEVKESPEEKPVEKSPKPQPIEEPLKEKDINKQNPQENINNKSEQ